MGRRIVIVTLSLAVLGTASLLIFAALARPRLCGCGGPSCSSNIKQVGLALLVYAQDWDNVLPGEDWADQILPYLQNPQVFVCPARTRLPVGYAMNRELAHRDVNTISRPEETVLVFDSDLGGSNPIGGPEAVPEYGVHGSGLNLCLANGHMRWARAGEARWLLERPVD